MTPKSEIDPLDVLAEEFVERLRRGERPSIGEYVDHYPDAADRIRELFPALAAMEGVAAVLTSDGTASAPTEVVPHSLPERIGDYRILREVGRGGMGVVYEAEQESLGRHVALKVLLPEYQSRSRFLERFRREARAAGRLHHTNIVPVFGVGESDGTSYYVMQFIAGVGLDQVIRDVRRLRSEAGQPVEAGPPSADETLSVAVAQGMIAGKTDVVRPPATRSGPVALESSHLTQDGGYVRSAARLALQAARALEHAHIHGIVHRDIKPSNFLLDVQGNLWVTDFGLAKTEEASDLTGSHDILGTMRYMSPERFAGQPVDARADIYALGLTLYEMLALRPAFTEYDRIKLMQQIDRGNFRRPRELDPNIPRDLETIVLKAAARDPKDRYPSARDLAEDLELFLANRPIKSRRASSWEHLRRWAKRNPVVAALTATVAILLVAVTAISLVSNARLGATNKDLDAKTLALGRSLDEQGKLRAKAQDEAFQARIEATRAGRYSGRRGQRFEGSNNIKKALELAPGRSLLELRNEAVGCLALPDVEVAGELPWPAGSAIAAFTSDLKVYARGNTDGTISLRRVEGDIEVAVLPSRGRCYDYGGLIFSPDGQCLCVTTPRHTCLWRIDGDEPVELLCTGPATLGGASFRCDGKELVVSSGTGVFRGYSCDTGQLVWVIPGQTNSRVVSCHPTRPMLVAYTTSTSVVLLNTETRRKVWERPVVPNGRRGWLAWHPEGNALAVAADPLEVRVMSAESGLDLVQPMSGYRVSGIVVWFNPAGDRLFSTDWQQWLRVWDWRAGKLLFETHVVSCLPPTFGPDGETLAGFRAHDKLQLWRFAAGRECTRIAPPEQARDEGFRNAVLSRDGRFAAASAMNGIQLIDTLRAEEPTFVPIAPRDRFHPVRFDPEHSTLWVAGSDGSRTGGGLYSVPLLRADNRLRIGKAIREIAVNGQASPDIGVSADARWVSIPMMFGDEGTLLFQRSEDRLPRVLGPQADVRFSRISPDGRWVITGSHGDSSKRFASVELWEVASGEHVARLEDKQGMMNFSPDSRWAVTHNGDRHEARIWDTTTWTPGPYFANRGWPVFSANSRFLATGADQGVVRIVRVPSGEEVVRLSLPEKEEMNVSGFSADGGVLLAWGLNSRALFRWDLFALRRQLREMGLDWDDSPIPPAASPFRLPPALAIEVERAPAPPPKPSPKPAPKVLRDPKALWILDSLLIAEQPLHPGGYSRRADDLKAMNRFEEAIHDADMALRLSPESADLYLLRGRIKRASGDLRSALADFHRAIELAPASTAAHADRAATALRLRDEAVYLESVSRLTVLLPNDANWQQSYAAALLAAESSKRDVPAALEAAEAAVRLAPANSFSQILLGYARYESGQTEAAAKAFAESRRLRAPAPYESLNLFGLALCAHRSGDDVQARAWFGQAIATKDTGRFQTDFAERLFRRMYAEAAEALALPRPKER